MARVTLIPQKKMNKTISNLPGVKGAVRAKAGEIGVRAEMRLAGHRVTGAAHIEVEHNFPGAYGHIDSRVSLIDEAALSIEYGHHLFVNGQRTGKHIAGLYIVRGAAGLA